ncbi:MAG TPA: GDSL-type esterase/lipase family protein [Jatrophihabitantaceae bacterium]|jgi:lysophospholipase L1-like esterase|nr:GDSL-type esterase/lipase family protein [Jatrophihabitantaceae bacterium]
MTSARLAAVTLAAFVVAGCTSSTSGTSPSTSASPTRTTQATTSAPSGTQYYVSIGDSYAAGYQPTSHSGGHTTRNGFAYQVVPAAKARGYDLTLVNFGCSGATTASVLHAPGCAASALGPGAAPYGPKTQAGAAEDFVRTHRAQIALVTVSIGGNDITTCGFSASPLTCLTPALDTVKTNLAALLAGLRAAGGPGVRIVGITYPDVLLAGELSPDAATRGLAPLSVQAFRSLINPALMATYSTVGATFVDVTAATGAYGSLSATTTLAPYGTIPVPVAKVCQLTYACQYTDIHPRTNGYAIIAKLVAGTLPSR